jgi:cell division protein FtsW
MERLRRFYPDPVLLFSVILLILMGFLMTLSVRVAPHLFSGMELYHFKKPLFFLFFSLIGLLTMSAVSYFLNYKKLNNQKVVYTLVGFSLFLLLLVLLKKIALGKPVERWLLGSSVQPSELSKLIVIVFIAYYVARKGSIDRLRFFGWAILIVVLHSLLLFTQPDKGMAIFILLIAWGLLWIGGTSPRIYIPIGALFIGVALSMILFGGDYVHRRLLAWQDPLRDSFGSGYQVIQSLLSFISGGLLGQGYGKGFQKLGPLTQADTDYVLATIGEELGFPGVLFITVLYTVLVWRLVRIAREVSDIFGKLIVAGVMLNIALSTMVSILMTVNILPPKGIALPFVSYGVSNLLVNLLGLGLVGAVYKRQLQYRAL